MAVKEKFLLFSIVLLATSLRIYLILRDSVPFAYDMGRDLLWAKDIVFYQTPTLIGPAASIWGVYFGPLWFYFLSVPLLVSNGHPLSAVFSTAATIIAAGALGFFLFKKYLGSRHAFVLSILILFNGTLVNISTFAFHANVLPLLTILMIYFCFLAVIKNPIFLSLAFLAVSLMFHSDPAPAVVNTFVPIAVAIIFKLHKSKNFRKTLFYSAAAYTAPFTPQMLFELRHNFIQTKSLMAYFLGQNPSLSGQLPFLERVANRLAVFFEFFTTSFAGGNIILAILFLVFSAVGIYQFLKMNKDKNLSILFKINALVLITVFLIFTVVFTVEVKNWYLYGITIPFAILITFALYGFKKYQLLTMSYLAIYLVVNISPFFKSERIISSIGDPARLSNQLAAIDTIYGDSPKNPFAVYVFTPSIYDYHYQYLFWWQGQKVGRGLPQDFSYLPNQPDYVRNKNFYAKKPTQSNLVYLIIENAPENEFYTRKDWLKNFTDYKPAWEKDINSAITVQKRQQ